ncbi:MAG: mersacidin/lichenicidin family type 2 lantibiotic [Hyalangium sp.]|uniref:mersacidin/lichenicidin family type 2 lantibiotic n=1 Tax=Hyalangium sp. TaxID=2028555 RepID=UPI003899E9AA
MSNKTDIIRAWKDEEFRSQLSESEKDMIPANPAGILELTDEALETGALVIAPSSCDWCSC